MTCDAGPVTAILTSAGVALQNCTKLWPEGLALLVTGCRPPREEDMALGKTALFSSGNPRKLPLGRMP